MEKIGSGINIPDPQHWIQVPIWSKKSVFADPVDCLHEVEDVVSTVHEEAGDDDVQTGDVLRVVVHVQKVARRHREPVQSSMSL